jgi:hypothetical protein
MSYQDAGWWYYWGMFNGQVFIPRGHTKMEAIGAYKEMSGDPRSVEQILDAAEEG